MHLPFIKELSTYVNTYVHCLVPVCRVRIGPIKLLCLIVCFTKIHWDRAFRILIKSLLGFCPKPKICTLRRYTYKVSYTFVGCYRTSYMD